ncbi:MAG: AEC family transporter [Sphaerochaetaceae bacterium]
MLINSFIQMLPILLIALGGYLTKSVFDVDSVPLAKVAADFFMPMLIFHSIYLSDLHGNLVLKISGAVIFIVALHIAIVYLYTSVNKIDFRDFLPATVFMNSGFLGIPLMSLWGGLAAVNIVIIYDQILTLLLMSVGLMIITGGFSTKSLTELLKSPILWAVILGFVCKYLNIPIAEPILRTLEFGGNVVPPLATYLLGLSLAGRKVIINRHVFAAIILKLGVGFLLGLLAAYIFRLSGLSRTVVIVISSLPSAVFTSVLPLRYGIKAEYSGTIVMLTTIVSVVTIPIAFMLAG